MSCRVFKRTLEYTIMYEFLKEAKSRNIKTVYGKYIPTQKNKIVSELYAELGFSNIGEEDDATIFELCLEKYDIPTNSNITLEELL